MSDWFPFNNVGHTYGQQHHVSWLVVQVCLCPGFYHLAKHKRKGKSAALSMYLPDTYKKSPYTGNDYFPSHKYREYKLIKTKHWIIQTHISSQQYIYIWHTGDDIIADEEMDIKISYLNLYLHHIKKLKQFKFYEYTNLRIWANIRLIMECQKRKYHPS